MAESEQQAAHDLAASALAQTMADAKRSQWLGFVVALAALAVAGLLVFRDQFVGAVVLGVATVAALAAAFVLGRDRSPDAGTADGGNADEADDPA